MNRKQTLFKALAAIMLFLAIALGQTAFAQTDWEVTRTINGNIATFQIKHVGSYSNQTKVRYRTVNLSAYEGQHYHVIEVDGTPSNASNGDLTFPAGTNVTKTVKVEWITPTSESYKYYEYNTYRKFRFEVTDMGGFELGSIDCQKYHGTSITYSTAYGIKDVTVNSGTITVTDDNYSQDYHAVPVNDYFDHAAPKGFFATTGAELRMTLSFQAKEKNDGYQHVQILVNQTSNHDEGAGDDNPGTIYYSHYMACFCHEGGSTNTTYSNYVFPDVTHGNNCGNVGHVWTSINSTNDVGELRQQKFNTRFDFNCRADDGRLVLSNNFSTFQTLGIRFDASGDNADTWYANNTVAHLQAVDATAPTMLAVSVAPGYHANGNTVYVSVALSEIVKVTGTPTLSTNNNWGSLSYVEGSGTNVLTFSTTIPQNASGKLNITGLSGTVKDLAGKSLVGSGVTASNLCSLNTSYAYHITYDLAGGSVATANPTTYTYETATFSLNNPTKLGYNFTGWTGSNGNTPQTTVSIAYHSHGDKYYTANWDPHTYSVRFHANDGTGTAATGTMDDQDFTYGVAQNLTANAFSREGYTFTSWNRQADGGGTSYTNQQEIINLTPENGAIIDLYAQWDVHHYTVHFDKNNDDATGTMADQNFTYDVAQDLTNNGFSLNSPNIVFEGWSTTPDGTVAYTNGQNVNNLTNIDNGTVTLYAQWKSYWGGSTDGSQDNPYLISTPEDLVLLSNRVNGANGETANSYYGKFFKLGNDIDMDGIAFEGIGYGSGSNEFQGNFNGDNKIISNVTIDRPTENYIGFFGKPDYGTIKNLILDGANITGRFYVGVLAGKCNKNIQNCLVLNSSVTTNTGTNNIGIIYGVESYFTSIANNHYRDCSVTRGGNTYTANIGTNHGDVDGARSIHTLTIPERVTATSTDTVTYNHVLYYASNVSVTLTPEMYYAISNVTVNGEAATNNGDGTWSFDMPAAAATVSATVNLKLPGTGEANNPYMISTTAQFDLVATLVNNGEIFNGVYFKLADNANITVSNMIGTSEHPFSGNFDGNRINNATLTLDLLFDTEMIYTAPFRYVSGANIHDLVVGGNMRIGNNSQYAASIVAHSEGTTILNNCVSNVEINSEAHNNCAFNGGLVGHVASGSTLNITNCVFKGNVYYHNSGQCCGFVGLNQGTTNINGGIYEPSYQQLDYNYDYYNFINPDMGTYSLTDCYYTQPMGESWQGTIAYTSVRDNLCHQISIAGETVYASPDDTFIDNVNGVYDYTGAAININPTVIFGGETLDPLCYTLSLTYNGNPATEVNAPGNYLFTAAGVNANGYYGNVYYYFSVVGFDGNGTDSDPYLIESIEDWNKLASRVEAGTTYSGKHFKLMANLTITKVVGKTKIQSFQGIFDGNGHTLTLNGDDFGTSGHYTSFHVCAPFRYVAGTTIKNLKVAGDIYTRTQFAGGLIGRAGDGNNVIQNCIVSVNIHSSVSGDGTHGGFIAHLQGGNGALSETTFSGCAFTGSITTNNNTTNVGGFVGWCEWGNGPDNGHCRLFFNDCFINPSASCISEGSKTFARCNDESQSLHFNNGYFTQAIGDEQGQRVENDGALPIGSYTVYNVIGLKFYDNGVKDSDGTFYHNTNALSNAIERQFFGYGDNNDHWAFIASPVEGNISPNDVNNLVDNNEADYDLYRLNPSNTRWENWKAHEGNAAPNFNFVNGMGYLYATKSNRIATFTGTLNMGSEKTIAGLPNGYNLVGNPFCIEAYINKPYYTLDDNGAIIVANPVDKATPIQPCYGVIVKVENNEDIVFRTTEPFTNSNNGSLEMTLAQTVATRDGNALKTLDNAIISFTEGSQLGKFYFGTQPANIYIPQDGNDYAIACAQDRAGEMPLCFKAHENGEYTLSFDVNMSLRAEHSGAWQPEGSSTEGRKSTLSYLHLIDNLTGNDVDLLATPSYTFTAKTTDYASRFKLVFNSNSAEGNDDFAFIDAAGNLIVNGTGLLQVFDVLGHQLYAKQLPTPNSSLLTPNFPGGVYVLRLINRDNVKTQKLIIK